MSAYQNNSGNPPTGNAVVKVTEYERSAEKLVDGESKKIYNKSLAKSQVKKKGK
jgi:hypothetical protein